MKLGKELSKKYTGRMASMADLPRIHQLEEKKSLHYHGSPFISLERLRNEYELPGFDLTKSIRYYSEIYVKSGWKCLIIILILRY